MKLLELSTEHALDALCEITPHVYNIVGDDNLLNEFMEIFGDNEKDGEKQEKTLVEYFEIGAKKINTIIPILLKDKRDDIFSIVAILNNKTVEEIYQQSGLQTMKEIKELLNDKELLDFFK